METEYSLISAITLGFLLGLKHATDADHVVDVVSIVDKSKNIWRGLWVGFSWGLGHTAPLLILGIIILLFKEAVLDKYESIAPFFEFLVGIMLVLLGIQVFWQLKKNNLHIHQHQHDEKEHVHIHTSHQFKKEISNTKKHDFFKLGAPTFRTKSFFVGIIHGLAGSAAVMLVLLPSIQSIWVGIAYLILFGVGTVLSMSFITVFLAVPFSMSSNNKKLYRYISSSAGTISILFGVALMSDIGLGTSLIPF